MWYLWYSVYMQTYMCLSASVYLYLWGNILSPIPFKSGGGVGSANIRSRATLALSPVCSVAHSLQHTLIEALNWASPLELYTFVPAGVSPCVNDDVEAKRAPRVNTFVIRETLQRNPSTPGQLRERSWVNISATCKNAHHCAKLLLWASFSHAVWVHFHWDLTDLRWSSQWCVVPPFPLLSSFIFCFFMITHVWLLSIPFCHCGLLVHYRPLSFLLSHPCSNQPHKQACRTKWLTSEGGVARRAQPFTVFSL